MKFSILLFLPLAWLMSSEENKDILYTQTTDKVSALFFVGVPPDGIEKRKEAIKGELADRELISFSMIVLRVRNEQNRESADAIIHAESLALLESSTPSLQIMPMIKMLESGDFLYLDSNPKFFVTEQKISEAELGRFFSHHNAKPNRSMVFYHYDKEKHMLIGTRFFVVDENPQPKIQIPARN